MQEIVVTGRVVHGLQEARALGYPTANIAYEPDSGTLLEPGVYAGRVLGVVLNDPEYEYSAAIVVGGDFKIEPPLKLEAHILDVDSSLNLYGREITVRIIEKMRDLDHFENVEDLKKQIAADVAEIWGFFYTTEAAF